MTDLMCALYDHVQMKEVPKYLMTEERLASRKSLDVHRKSLLEKYPGLEEPLDEFLDQLSYDYALELEAMFQAAFTLGLRLPQLL